MRPVPPAVVGKVASDRRPARAGELFLLLLLYAALVSYRLAITGVDVPTALRPPLAVPLAIGLVPTLGP